MQTEVMGATHKPRGRRRWERPVAASCTLGLPQGEGKKERSLLAKGLSPVAGGRGRFWFLRRSGGSDRSLGSSCSAADLSSSGASCVPWVLGGLGKRIHDLEGNAGDGCVYLGVWQGRTVLIPTHRSPCNPSPYKHRFRNMKMYLLCSAPMSIILWCCWFRTWVSNLTFIFL